MNVAEPRALVAEGRELLAALDEPIRRATENTLAHMESKRLELLRELLEEARSSPQ